MEYNKNFLSLMDTVKVKRQFIRLTLLSFNEQEIREIKGIVTSGNISVNGSSAVRRTINLSMAADKNTNNLENINNLISLNKKVKVDIGFYNPLVNYQETYGKEIWFPQGVFIISGASVNATATGCTISLQGKDKMAMLDGTVGGTLPASVTFHETYVQDYDTEDITVEYPTIYRIIQEAVNHFGGEALHKIFINDLSQDIKLLTKYIGDTPIWFVSNDNHRNFVISDSQPEGYSKEYTYGEDVGYVMTDFTYPGDLILGAGATVTTLLDNITKVLPNYEYFYDVNGNFIFQEKPNYKHNHYTPLITYDGQRGADEEYANSIEGLQPADYIRTFNNSKFVQSFTDAEGVTSFNNNPKYDNVKNDFIVWGQRETTAGTKHEIRYHLAIDEKPSFNLCGYDMWEVFNNDSSYLVRYAYTSSGTQPTVNTGERLGEKPIGVAETPNDYEWREELYRQAKEIWITSGQEGAYDDELAAEWRKLYDRQKCQTYLPEEEWGGPNDWKTIWENHGYGTWTGWNPDVIENPANLDYWLDFIDSPTLGQYSVKMIGRRTKVINDSSLKSIYNKEVPDVIFVENPGNIDDILALYQKYDREGQDFCFLQSEQMELFTPSGTSTSCYEKIRELLDQNLIYNTTITINCLARYYLEPNQLIYVQDKNSGIEGSFVISSFNLPLQYNGMMSITATQAISRV